MGTMEGIDFDKQAKYLFLVAHPDDEVFISGTLRLLLDHGSEVHGIWATSGDFFGMAAHRERELTKAMSILGLDDSQIHLLRFPDLSIVSRLDEVVSSTSIILSKIKPDSIFVNAYEGGHPDHDAVNFIAYESCYRAGLTPRLYEFPLYNGTGPFYYWWWRICSFPPGNPPVLYNSLNDAAIRCRHRMIRTYYSQWMYMLPLRLASTRRRMTKLGEPYRICPPDRDHTIPPHPGKLNYERWFNFFMKTTFDNFKDAVSRVQKNRSKIS